MFIQAENILKNPNPNTTSDGGYRKRPGMGYIRPFNCSVSQSAFSSESCPNSPGEHSNNSVSRVFIESEILIHKLKNVSIRCADHCDSVCDSLQFSVRSTVVLYVIHCISMCHALWFSVRWLMPLNFCFDEFILSYFKVCYFFKQFYVCCCYLCSWCDWSLFEPLNVVSSNYCYASKIRFLCHFHCLHLCLIFN